MIINRVWAMPNKWTFQIKPIKKLVERYVGDGVGWVDPFSGTSTLAEYTNDLNPEMPSRSHMLALDYVKGLPGPFNGVIFDPPYSGRQVVESYKGVGLHAGMNDCNSYFYRRL